MKLKQSKENNVAVDNVDYKRILEITCSRWVLAMTSDKPIMLGIATYLRLITCLMGKVLE